ncbi:MAG TPA: phage tail tape measure protein, partial [Candidatus Limnocylindrales bacterium]
MSTHKLSILVEALGTGDVNRKLKGVDKTLNSIGARAHKGIGTAASNLVRLGEAAAVGVAGGLAYAVKQAGDFEASMNTIATIVDRSQLPQIGQEIRGIARETGTGVDELSAAYYDLVSAGVKAADATSVLTNATHLAIGGLGTTTETVDLLTTAMNAYGLTADGVTKATDMFAQAIADGKVKASEIAGTFSHVAALAKAFGVGIDQVAASYAFLTAQGVDASSVTTEFARAIQDITKPTGKAAQAIKQLQKDYHLNFQKMLKEKGLVPTLEAMRVAAEKAGIPFQQLFGRKEGFLFALQTTGPAFAGFQAELAKIKDSAGEANAQFAERQQGLNFQLARLKALAVDAAITIGSTLLPKITPLVEKLNALISGHQGDIAKFGDEIASAFDKIAAYADRIPWGAIGDGLKTAGFWAGKLFDVFTSLPPQAQATLVALAGLNKLSGGAISGIVGELGKGLIKGVLGMNAGVVNIKAAVV